MTIEQLDQRQHIADQVVYDTVIVGGGIGGLYLAWYLQRLAPKDRIIVLEASETIGGRVDSASLNFNHEQLYYELGAGRVSSTNWILLQLVDHFDLTLTPLDSSFQWSDGKTTNSFASTLAKILPVLAFLQIIRIITPTPVLVRCTILDLLNDYFSPRQVKEFTNRFPYTSEISIANAFDGFSALDSFGFQNSFYLVKEGLSSLVDGLSREFEQLGGTIFTESKVVAIESESSLDPWMITDSEGLKRLSKRIIFTCNYYQLGQLEYFHNKIGPLIENGAIAYQPLLRIYATYPTSELDARSRLGARSELDARSRLGARSGLDARSGPWFKDLPRTVTNGPLRLVIPISEETGLIMVSYTDGPDAEWWWPFIREFRLGRSDPLINKVTTELQQLFPERNIPEPLTLEPCYWKRGGNFNQPNREGWTSNDLRKLIETQLDPGLYIANNDLSNEKNWIEGSLRETHRVISRILS